jgi:biotin operon repressor
VSRRLDGRYPSLDELANFSGFSRRTVIDQLKLLEEQGWYRTNEGRRLRIPDVA